MDVGAVAGCWNYVRIFPECVAKGFYLTPGGLGVDFCSRLVIACIRGAAAIGQAFRRVCVEAL